MNGNLQERSSNIHQRAIEAHSLLNDTSFDYNISRKMKPKEQYNYKI